MCAVSVRERSVNGGGECWGGLTVRELRQLREENRKLKGLAADLSLGKQILREALGKKG